MSTPNLIPSLFLFTLIAVLLIATVGYLLFLRKRGNRHPVEKPSQAGKTMAPTHDEDGT
jgi:predicted exporter